MYKRKINDVRDTKETIDAEHSNEKHTETNIYTYITYICIDTMDRETEREQDRTSAMCPVSCVCSYYSRHTQKYTSIIVLI